MSIIEINVDEITQQKIESLERQLKSKITECKNKEKIIEDLLLKIKSYENHLSSIDEIKLIANQLIDKLNESHLVY